MTKFRQVQPVEGGIPSEPTEVRILYDADNLYIGIRCTDEPQGVLGNDMSHDSLFTSDDYVAVVIDAFGRKQESYYFAVNPAGAWADGLVSNAETLDLSWDANWSNRVQRDATGWTVEMVIPFKSISFTPALQEWGINFERKIRRKQELDRWAAANRARKVYSLAELGRLTGLVGLRQGLGVELHPFARFQHNEKSTTSSAADSFKAGGELIWHILPSLNATLTINTDFAETDVDARQVNLTRFPLFYPEKRDFFLRDGTFFAFGGLTTSTSFIPYYSRRIGLGANGTQSDLPFGAKIAGRAGPVTIGLFDTVVDANGAVPRQNLSVGRVACQILGNSSVGLIFTNGDPRGAGRNTVIGADFNLSNDTWVEGKTILGHAWVLGSRSDAAGGKDTAAEIELNYPNDPWSFDVFVRHVGEKFDPALGFADRAGIRLYDATGDFFSHPNGSVIRDIDWGAHAGITTDLHDRELREDIDISRITFTNPAGDQLRPIWPTVYADRVLTPFAIAPGVVIPPGFYRWPQLFKMQLITSPHRQLSGLVYFRFGDYYKGKETEQKGSVTWRPDHHWNLTGTYDLYQIKLPEGHFNVRILSGSITYAWSPYLSASALIQYDTQSRFIGENFRLRWRLTAGNDIFLAVNRGYLNQLDGSWVFQGAQDILKVGWTWQR